MIFFFWWHHQVLLFFNSAPSHLFTYTFQSTSEAHTYRKHANRDSTPKQAPPPQLDCLINSRTVFPLLVLLTLTLRMIWDPPEAVLFPEVSNTLSPSRLTRRPIIFLCAAMVHIKPIKASSSSTQRMKLSWKCSILLRTSGRSDCRLLSAHTNVKEPSAKALQENNIVTYCGRCKIDERALVYFSERTSQTLTVNK